MLSMAPLCTETSHCTCRGALLDRTLQAAWQILTEDGSEIRAEIESKVCLRTSRHVAWASANAPGTRANSPERVGITSASCSCNVHQIGVLKSGHTVRRSSEGRKENLQWELSHQSLHIVQVKETLCEVHEAREREQRRHAQL